MPSPSSPGLRPHAVLDGLRSRRGMWPYALAIAVATLLLPLAPASAARSPSPSKPDPAETATEPESEAEDSRRFSPARLQAEVMGFSDEYVSAMWAVMEDYIRREPDASKRVLAQSWKVQYGSASMTIAGGHDPRTSLLDMAIFISVGKWAVDRHWVPKVFGPEADGLRKLYAEQDRKIWKLISQILTPEQQLNLRALIVAWEEDNPAIHEVADLRLRTLEGVRPGQFDAKSSARGIMASVRRLLGRVDTSLLYGERVLFYLERTPRILTQQTDLTLAQIAEAFPIAALRPETLPSLSGDWPTRLQEGIDHNHALAKDLLPEVRTTVETAQALTVTVNQTATTVQQLTAQLSAEPLFAAEDFSRSLQEINASLDHLDSTIGGINQLLEKYPEGGSKVLELTQLIDGRMEHAVDHVFHRTLLLIAALTGAVLVILIAIRLLFPRPQPLVTAAAASPIAVPDETRRVATGDQTGSL